MTKIHQRLLLVCLLLASAGTAVESKSKSPKAPKSSKSPKAKSPKKSGKSERCELSLDCGDFKGCIESGESFSPTLHPKGGDENIEDDGTGENCSCCSGWSVGGVCCLRCDCPVPITDRTGLWYDEPLCCTGKAQYDSLLDAAFCSGFCRRRLYSEDGYQRDPTKERSLEIIESMEANPDAKFIIENNILPAKTCKDLAEYTEYWFHNDEEPHFPFGHENVYKKFIGVSKFVEIVGKESAHKIIDFFETHRGPNEPITEVYLTRHAPSTDNEMYYTDWHKDCYSAMEIQLGNFTEPQEWLIHLTRNGPERYKGLPGTAMIHGQDIAHGTPPFFGDSPKYLLVLKHHPEDIVNYHPKDVCLNKDIVNDLLKEL